MKKLALLLLLGLVLLPTAIAQCAPDQTIFRISAPTNAHAELWNGAGDYPVEICYEDIFGVGPYPGPIYHPACDATNAILWASDTTNAHVEMDFPGLPQNYSEPICYGDILSCDYVLDPNPCTIFDPAAECIVTISDFTNAHVSICDDPASFDQKVCCVSSFASSPMCSITSVAPDPIPENGSTVLTVSYDNFVPSPFVADHDIDCGDGADPSAFSCDAVSCTFTCGPYAPGPDTYPIVVDLDDLAGLDVPCGTVNIDVLGPVPGCFISAFDSPINVGDDSLIEITFLNFPVATGPLEGGPNEVLDCSDVVGELATPDAAAPNCDDAFAGTCSFSCENYGIVGAHNLSISLDNGAPVPEEIVCGSVVIDVNPAPCGDGVTNAGETCDVGLDGIPGNADDDDVACPGLCQAGCSCPLPIGCGDGIVDAPAEGCEIGVDGVLGTPDDIPCEGPFEVCQGNCTCFVPLVGQPFLTITRFNAQPRFFPAPSTAVPPNSFSNIRVNVLNSGDGAEPVMIELQVFDPVTNLLILDPPTVGCGVVAASTECERVRIGGVDDFPGLDISSLAPGAYKLQASALDSIGAVHDRQAIFFTVARPLPLPEFNFLLLPLMAFSVLAVLFLSKRKS